MRKSLYDYCLESGETALLDEWDREKNALTPKLLGVSGVPQVMSYVLQGEVDAGFVNWQAAQKNRAKLGGVMAINEGYEPIEMVAAVVAGAEKDADVRKFLGCLASPKGKKVLEKAGVR